MIKCIGLFIESIDMAHIAEKLSIHCTLNIPYLQPSVKYNYLPWVISYLPEYDAVIFSAFSLLKTAYDVALQF